MIRKTAAVGLEQTGRSSFLRNMSEVSDLSGERGFSDSCLPSDGKNEAECFPEVR